jgi:hypothetical protein
MLQVGATEEKEEQEQEQEESHRLIPCDLLL